MNGRLFHRSLRRFEEKRRTRAASDVSHLGFFVRHAPRDTWIPVSVGRITLQHIGREEDTLA